MQNHARVYEFQVLSATGVRCCADVESACATQVRSLAPTTPRLLALCPREERMTIHRDVILKLCSMTS